MALKWKMVTKITGHSAQGETKSMTRIRNFTLAIAALLVAALPSFAQQSCDTGTRLHIDNGAYNASAYNTWRAQVATGNAATGAGSITVRQNGVALCDSYRFQPFYVGSPITIGIGSNAETVTVTAVSGCSVNGPSNACTVSASYSNLHGPGDLIVSGSAGAQEAAMDAFLSPAGGGKVAVGPPFSAAGGTDATLSALLPLPSVSIEDNRRGAPQMWNPMPTVTALLAAPTTLTGQAACDATHTFCSDATVAGSASWGGTVIGCITLVDINGNESPCSATNSFTSVASKAIDIGAPAARADNVVGWKPYLSLSGGSYALAYSLPLLTQPTTLLAVPVSSGVCTLTTLETITPACAIGNTKYGQTASATGAGGLFSAGGAQFTGYPVVTNTLAPEIGSVSALQHNPNEEAHATYAYVPGNRVGAPGIQSTHVVFPITAAAQTTIGEVVGSIPLPAHFMNFVGRTIEVCGLISKTSTVADTVDDIQVWWDAEGSNVTAGTPVQLSSIKLTSTGTAAFTTNFCQQLTTTVASTSATGGSILPGQGWLTKSQVAAGTVPVAAASSLVAAVGSLNLALPAHLTMELQHTTGTDGAGATLLGVTIRIVN